MKPLYDAIVLGAGGIGSAALLHAARRGARVLGIDRFHPPHDRGSSHGDTRVIRLAYFEHPAYVPLLRRAYALWAKLEAETGQVLYRESGLLQAGPAAGQVLSGIRASVETHGLEIEALDGGEIPRRFPGFNVPSASSGLFERRAGFLYVEKCIEAHLDLARRAGAELAFGEAAGCWRVDGAGVVVVDTDRNSYCARRLIVTPGPWASGMAAIGEIAPLTVLRQPLWWFACGDPRYDVSRGCPVFLFETGAGIYYGFPTFDGSGGIKVAQHFGGRTVADPLAVDRAIDPVEQARIERFLASYMPGVELRLLRHEVCMYTVTPDEHFIVDRHPEHPEVCFAIGLSGHGFKFAPLLGEVLADLAIDGRTAQPVGFLSLARFARS